MTDEQLKKLQMFQQGMMAQPNAALGQSIPSPSIPQDEDSDEQRRKEMLKIRANALNRIRSSNPQE